VVAIVTTALAVATPSVGSEVEIPMPHLFVELAAEPSPWPSSGTPRTPLSLRLASSIRTDDGSHPPAAKEIDFQIDRHFHLDLAGVPRCPFVPIQVYPGFDWSTCEKAQVGARRLKWRSPIPKRSRSGSPPPPRCISEARAS